MQLDKEIYETARYDVESLIAKIWFFEDKLKECIGKPKDLWKAIKSLLINPIDMVGALAENSDT